VEVINIHFIVLLWAALDTRKDKILT